MHLVSETTIHSDVDEEHHGCLLLVELRTVEIEARRKGLPIESVLHCAILKQYRQLNQVPPA